MRKISLSIACLLVLSLAAISVGAQTRARCTNRETSSNRRYDHSSSRGYNNQVYRNDSYRTGVNNNQVYRSGAYDNQVYRSGGYGTSVNNDSRYGDYGYYGDNRSVWERSRDKITTAAGAGGGAVVGGMIGGKRGAIIGAITGGGAAALYTYKIRDKYRY